MAKLNLGSLSSATTSAQALSNLVLVTPDEVRRTRPGYQPQGQSETDYLGPKLLFNYEGENTVTLESDITDHYVEDNTAINDQIALKPEVITVSGYIGELTDVIPDGLGFEAARFAAEKLLVIQAYTPELTVAALRAYNRALLLYSVGVNAQNAAVASWSSITKTSQEAVITGTSSGTDVNLLASGSLKNQNKQQVAFQQFYGYWRNRTLFTVQTPWAIFKNMAIKSLRAVQLEDSNSFTNFEVTFKIMRFAGTELDLALNPQANPTSERVDPKRAEARSAYSMQTNPTKLGPTSGVPSLGVAEAVGSF